MHFDGDATLSCPFAKKTSLLFLYLSDFNWSGFEINMNNDIVNLFVVYLIYLSSAQ